MTDEAKDNATDMTEQLKTITSAIAGMAEGMKGIQDTVGTLTGNVDKLQELSKAPVVKDPEPEPEPEYNDADIERLSRKDFMDLITGGVVKKIEGMLTTVNTNVSEVSNTVEQNELSREITKANSDHTDFQDFIPEMKILSNQYKDLSIEDMYQLAKSNNPTKVEELVKAAEEAEKEGKPAPKTNGYGGLTPTSGAQTDIPTNMKPSEAAETAWDACAGDLNFEDT